MPPRERAQPALARDQHPEIVGGDRDREVRVEPEIGLRRARSPFARRREREKRRFGVRPAKQGQEPPPLVEEGRGLAEDRLDRNPLRRALLQLLPREGTDRGRQIGPEEHARAVLLGVGEDERGRRGRGHFNQYSFVGRDRRRWMNPDFAEVVGQPRVRSAPLRRLAARPSAASARAKSGMKRHSPSSAAAAQRPSAALGPGKVSHRAS